MGDNGHLFFDLYGVVYSIHFSHVDMYLANNHLIESHRYEILSPMEVHIFQIQVFMKQLIS